MGSQKWADKRFGERVKAERDHRGWSQAEMAKILSDRGIHPMHPTTVAKIEAGDRSVRINEAVGIADLFEVSLDSLLGRKPGAQRDELQYLLRVLRDTARQSSQQVWSTMETLREQLEELPKDFEHSDMLQRVGYNTWANHLDWAHDELMGLVNLADELMRRQQGTPRLTDEALMELEVPEETLETLTQLRSPKQTFTELKKALMEPEVPKDGSKP
jgi:transcriptional regulator with XRE-family HTH domain